MFNEVKRMANLFYIYMANTILLLLFVFLLYYFGCGMTFLTKTYINNLVTYGCVFLFFQLLTRKSFFSKSNLLSCGILLWWNFFVLFKLVIFNCRKIDHELLFGLYVILFIALLDYFSVRYDSWFLRIFSWFSAYCVVFITMVTYIHCMVYGKLIVYDEISSVLYTDIQETKEWICSYIGFREILFFLSVTVLYIFAIRYLMIIKKSMAEADGSIQGHSWVKNFLLVFISFFVVVNCVLSLRFTDWVFHAYIAIRTHLVLNVFNDSIREKTDRITFKENAMAVKSPHTVIVIIGESACRDLMQAYNVFYKYPNTPWMSTLESKSDFVVFKNIYSKDTTTGRALSSVLTENSQFNLKLHCNSMNIIDLARKRGYKTYWITNTISEKGVNQEYAMIAGRSDIKYYHEKKYDDDLLRYLNDIDPKENNFVVINGMGSHNDYVQRYPKDRIVFNDGGVEAEYANAVRYVDDFLKYVFEYGKGKLNLQLMVYFSDHGENLITGHAPIDFSFDKVRIPMFIYFGDEYKVQNSDRYKLLRERKNTFYTNDMMYNTLGGLINAESNYYDATEDLSSIRYDKTLNDLRTFGGLVKVADDPNLK